MRSGSPTSWPGTAIPKDVLTSSSVAVDGTDVETWGALHGEPSRSISTARRPRPSCRTSALGARVEAPPSGQGPRGRPRRTQAVHRRPRCPGRAPGHQQPAGRALCRLRAAPGRPGPGRPVDQLCRPDDPRIKRSPASSPLQPGPCRHPRGKAVVEDLVAAKSSGSARDVVWDPGYSLCRPGHRPPPRSGRHRPDLPTGHPPAGK